MATDFAHALFGSLPKLCRFLTATKALSFFDLELQMWISRPKHNYIGWNKSLYILHRFVSAWWSWIRATWFAWSIGTLLLANAGYICRSFLSISTSCRQHSSAVKVSPGLRTLWWTGRAACGLASTKVLNWTSCPKAVRCVAHLQAFRQRHGIFCVTAPRAFWSKCSVYVSSRCRFFTPTFELGQKIRRLASCPWLFMSSGKFNIYIETKAKVLQNREENAFSKNVYATRLVGIFKITDDRSLLTTKGMSKQGRRGALISPHLCVWTLFRVPLMNLAFFFELS